MGTRTRNSLLKTTTFAGRKPATGLRTQPPAPHCAPRPRGRLQTPSHTEASFPACSAAGLLSEWIHFQLGANFSLFPKDGGRVTAAEAGQAPRWLSHCGRALRHGPRTTLSRRSAPRPRDLPRNRVLSPGSFRKLFNTRLSVLHRVVRPQNRPNG